MQAWRSRPVLIVVAFLVIVAIGVDWGGDALRLNGAEKTILAALVCSVGLFCFGVLNKNINGGFAVFVGLIALVTTILFAAMYAMNPALFRAIQ